MNTVEATKPAEVRRAHVPAIPTDPIDLASDTSVQAIAAAQSNDPVAKQFKIYAAYGWSSDSGKKHGFGGVILNSSFPEIETEAQLNSAFVELAKAADKPNVVPLYFLPLEG